MTMPFSRALIPAALAALLAACGGGGDDPEPTPVGATLTVSNATSASFNGVYSTGTIALTEVRKFNEIGPRPEQCIFEFSGLAGPNGQSMNGDIRYTPGSDQLQTAFISIGGFEFRSDDSTNVLADRTNGRIVFSGKTLRASSGVASNITLSGELPMRGDRPEGC